MARKQFTKTCVALAREKIRMRLFILSGEQSIKPSKDTCDDLGECLDYIDELIIGGGPGIAIERQSVASMEPRGSSVFKLAEQNFTLSRNEGRLDYYCSEDIPGEEKHPYIKMCQDFKERFPDQSEQCKYILEQLNPGEPTTLRRRHIALVEVEEKMPNGDTRSCFPLAVIEDLHLPFQPKQAAVYRYLYQGDEIYQKFLMHRNTFIENGNDHDTSTPPPHRFADISI